MNTPRQAPLHNTEQPSNADDDASITQCVQYLKALGDPVRLQAIRALRTGPLTVSDLAELLEIDITNISHHLRILFHAGLVTTSRDGKYIYYSLNSDLFKARSAKKQLDFGCCQLDLNSRSTPRTESRD